MVVIKQERIASMKISAMLEWRQTNYEGYNKDVSYFWLNHRPHHELCGGSGVRGDHLLFLRPFRHTHGRPVQCYGSDIPLQLG